jgi:hypothetical protein
MHDNQAVVQERFTLFGPPGYTAVSCGVMYTPGLRSMPP